MRTRRRRYVSVAVALGFEQLEALDALAAEERRSRSFLLRDAVDALLARAVRKRRGEAAAEAGPA